MITKRESQQKSGIDDLAIFGGSVAFDESLHVGRPNIGDRAVLLDRINDMLDRRWLTNNGPFAQEFEHRVAEFVGVRHCVAMCNATIALEIAIRALGMDGEVIVPSFTFVATAHALQWQEITPVFCDIDPQTHNLDPQQVERLITPRTSGIIGVHAWGRACKVEALTEIAQKRNLRLLFDAAHAFACTHKGQMIGGFGNAEVFSFHATKFFNTLEGGAVVTNDDSLAHKLRLMRNFGFTQYDRTDYVGTNGKINEVSAAMGLTNLESLDKFIAINHRNYLCYQRHLAELEGITLITFDESEKSNYQYIVLEIDPVQAKLTRDALVAILHAENILARRYFYPGCHKMEPYNSYFPNAGLLLPQTESLTERVLQLPSGTAIDENNIETICSIIRTALANPQETTAKLKTLT